MHVQRVDGDAWVEEYQDEAGRDAGQPLLYLVIGRLGGDEFILAGPHDTHQQAHEAMVRLRLWALARMTG